MTVALFVPCYVDQLYPGVAQATLEVLERQGCTVEVPLDQTCCGQPTANAGFERESEGAMQRFVETFAPYEAIVAPSGSCVAQVRLHYGRLEQTDAVRHVRERTFELCEFLTDQLDVTSLDARFPHRVGLHESCHGLRGLRLGSASELNVPPYSMVRRLLEMVDGLDLVPLDRADECCGFGGTFAVTEEALSVKMGRDRLRDHVGHGAEVITATDMSCLMHLGGLARRQALPVQIRHVAQILNGGALPVTA